jgi:hypothetical protein
VGVASCASWHRPNSNFIETGTCMLFFNAKVKLEGINKHNYTSGGLCYCQFAVREGIKVYM